MSKIENESSHNDNGKPNLKLNNNVLPRLPVETHVHLKKLKNLIRFLLFKEPQTRHKVIENLNILHAVIPAITTITLTSTIFLYTIQYGLIPMVLTQLTTHTITLEIYHILYDKP